ncbi:aryl-sulfate sulfotransferase, partial [Salmonella enterica subsp. enterica serovar Anatum]|nr:aryl-sulfate sulfotransferase [Salmonella enterica subsp. enterica serovar Anatum]
MSPSEFNHGGTRNKALASAEERTVRDVIAEVDQNGVVVDEWRLFDILDPYRDVIMKTLDQGAV